MTQIKYTQIVKQKQNIQNAFNESTETYIYNEQEQKQIYKIQ